MSTSRRLDLDRLWQAAAQQGIEPAMLARRAGMRLHDRDTLLHLQSLHDLTAPQLVALCDVLQVTVDELLTIEPDQQAFRSPQRDGDALHAALLRFGTLTEHQITTAFGWSPARLNTAVARLHRQLEPGGTHLRRVGHRLRLAPAPYALGDQVTQALTRLQAQDAALTGDLAPHLLVAVRAHGLGDPPGPPQVAWQIADTLAGQGAAASPGDRTHATQRVRLIPHPDLLFALRLTDQPADRPVPAPPPS